MDMSARSRDSGHAMLNGTGSQEPSTYPGKSLYEPPVYQHESIFRSDYINVSIRCPDAWIFDDSEDLEGEEEEMPVFGPNDLVGGNVTLSPTLVRRGKGRLSISIEGTFTFISPHLPSADVTLPQPLKHEHTFFAGNMVIATYPPSLPSEHPQTKSSRAVARGRHRTINVPSAENGVKRRTTLFGIRNLSLRNLNNTLRTMFERNSRDEEAQPPSPPLRAAIPRTMSTPHLRPHALVAEDPAETEWSPFMFSFPLAVDPLVVDEDLKLPRTFSSSVLVDQSGVRGRAFAENAEVSYRLIFEWSLLGDMEVEEATRVRMETPFLYSPVTDDFTPSGASIATRPSTRPSRSRSRSRKRSRKAPSVATAAPEEAREWADFVLDPLSVLTSPGAGSRIPLRAILTLPHPPTYFHNAKSISYFLFFAASPPFDFLAPDIRRSSEIKIELVRRVECDERRGGVWGVAPPVEKEVHRIPSSTGKVTTTATSAPSRDKRKRSLLERVTTPLLRSRNSPYPRDSMSMQVAEEERPKYLSPEKLLPPLPAEAEQVGAGVIVDERVIARDYVSGWRSGPAQRFQFPDDDLNANTKSLTSVERVLQEADRVLHANGYEDYTAKLHGGENEKAEGEPDGVVYGKLRLEQEMILSLRWEGVCVEYFLDVEVRYGNDVLGCRARIEITAED